MAALDRPWIGELFVRGRGQTAYDRPAEHWDNEFASGNFDRLSRSDQRHHLRLLAGMIAETYANPKIMEIGCGDGAFHRAIASHAPQRYLGVDLSSVAVERARGRYCDRAGTEFTVGDGARYETDELFDAVVFPECIEFLGDPVEVLSHYAKNLKPGGLFGVTQWLAAKPLRIWRAIKDTHEIVDEAVVNAAWGGAWQVWTCRPKHADQ